MGVSDAVLIDYSLKPYAGYNTAVFWDIDDCPIPDGLSASDVSSNIRKALTDKGCEDGRVDVLVYGDTDKILVDGQVPQGIHKVPSYPQRSKHFFVFLLLVIVSVIILYIFMVSGDDYARRRVLVDGILFWILANKHQLSNLMLIIGDISDNSGVLSFLHSLAFGGHNFLIAQDSNCRPLPIHHDLRFEWRWPDLAHGSAPVFIEQIPDLSCIPFYSESDCYEACSHDGAVSQHYDQGTVQVERLLLAHSNLRGSVKLLESS